MLARVAAGLFGVHLLEPLELLGPHQLLLLRSTEWCADEIRCSSQFDTHHPLNLCEELLIRDCSTRFEICNLRETISDQGIFRKGVVE